MKATTLNPETRRPIRIGLIDDHTLFRESLKHVLNAEDDIEVAGVACGLEDGLAMVGRVKPDILLQDICLGSDDGLKMMPEVKALAPNLKCLVLTGMVEDDLILRAIRKQADGYLLKDCSIEVLIDSIRKLAKGQKAWDHTLIARLAATDQKQDEATEEEGISSLNAAEQKVATLIAEGLTNREIGKRLHLAEKTIRNRVSLIMDKLHVTRRTKIAALYTLNAERNR